MSYYVPTFLTGVSGSCSFVLNGKMFVVGGVDFLFWKQISVIDTCMLNRVGTMPVEFEYAACNTFEVTPSYHEALLCFTMYRADGTGPKECHA